MISLLSLCEKLQFYRAASYLWETVKLRVGKNSKNACLKSLQNI